MMELKYLLRIAFYNGNQFYVIGSNGKVGIIGAMEECKQYIDMEEEK